MESKSCTTDPWYKSTLHFSNLTLHIPHDVFSTQRIDEGTQLLLAHLSSHAPQSVLDMGCGYGALGLPVAQRFPDARVEMVDRDLLAVKWSARNAVENKLGNVTAHGSLGFRDLHHSGAYDWILCNVPARIGRPFIENLMESGRARLNPQGDLRVVVINDLCPLLHELEALKNWPLVEVARGPRHTIFSLTAETQSTQLKEPVDLYLRDSVKIANLQFDRPFDLGGDDQKRLATGLPVLLDALPRQTIQPPVLCFRSGYGPLPLACLKRWPDAKIVAVDRDLLATAFTRRNAENLGLDGTNLEVRENAHFPDALEPNEHFGLILGELSPSAGENVAAAEIQAIAKSLNKGGQALLLCLEKLERDWVRPLAAQSGLSIYPVVKRDGYTVLRLS